MTIALDEDVTITTSEDAVVEHSEPEERLPRWRRLVSALFTLAIVAVSIFLWPAQLGGTTRLVIVAGHSMEPTYDLGDIAVTRGDRTSSVGDPVVFAVPEGGGKGILVIHRIIGIDDEGFFVTQGDNRDTPDRWQLTQNDIVGEPVLIIPKGGHLVFFLQQWIVIAALVGLLTVFVLWPRASTNDHADTDDVELDPADPAATAPKPTLVPPTHWSDSAIDQAIMDEAEAWLDEQLREIVPMSVR